MLVNVRFYLEKIEMAGTKKAQFQIAYGHNFQDKNPLLHFGYLLRIMLISYETGALDSRKVGIQCSQWVLFNHLKTDIHE